MKKLFTHVISLVVCGLLLFTGALQAGPDCTKTSGTGQTAAVAQGVFEGTAAVKIDGQSQNAAVTTYLLGAPETTEDGTQGDHLAYVCFCGREFIDDARPRGSQSDRDARTLQSEHAGNHHGRHRGICGCLRLAQYSWHDKPHQRAGRLAVYRTPLRLRLKYLDLPSPKISAREGLPLTLTAR